MISRKKFLQSAGLISAAGLITRANLKAAIMTETKASQKNKFWAEGERLVISVSMQFEAGGQPDNSSSPFPQDMKKGFKDYGTDSWYSYGYKEGIPRMLSLWDKYNIKVTSHITGEAALKNPALAKEIVERGHEASGHGMKWIQQYAMPYEEEKKFILDNLNAIEKTTGTRPYGYDATWGRRGVNTLKILQELGFTYFVDDLSRDEPFIIKVNNKDFAIIPYTFRCNDILLIEGKNFSPDQFLSTLKLEFDQLYEESEFQRRQMSVSFHDRIGGTPQVIAVVKQFFEYVSKQKGVVFKRKDEIAKMALADKNTLREENY
jgi:peptidoglycan/xylan/chitin deacetylase (PgdA/CDA1 family)